MRYNSSKSLLTFNTRIANRFIDLLARKNLFTSQLLRRIRKQINKLADVLQRRRGAHTHTHSSLHSNWTMECFEISFSTWEIMKWLAAETNRNDASWFLFGSHPLSLSQWARAFVCACDLSAWASFRFPSPSLALALLKLKWWLLCHIDDLTHKQTHSTLTFETHRNGIRIRHLMPKLEINVRSALAHTHTHARMERMCLFTKETNAIILIGLKTHESFNRSHIQMRDKKTQTETNSRNFHTFQINDATFKTMLRCRRCSRHRFDHHHRRRRRQRRQNMDLF